MAERERERELCKRAGKTVMWEPLLCPGKGGGGKKCAEVSDAMTAEREEIVQPHVDVGTFIINRKEWCLVVTNDEDRLSKYIRIEIMKEMLETPIGHSGMKKGEDCVKGAARWKERNYHNRTMKGVKGQTQALDYG